MLAEDWTRCWVAIKGQSALNALVCDVLGITRTVETGVSPVGSVVAIKRDHVGDVKNTYPTKVLSRRIDNALELYTVLNPRFVRLVRVQRSSYDASDYLMLFDSPEAAVEFALKHEDLVATPDSLHVWR